MLSAVYMLSPPPFISSLRMARLRTHSRFIGKYCVQKFCDYIKREAHRLYHMFLELPIIPLSIRQWMKFRESTICHICYEPFTPTNRKVKDHCHYTGLYRGPAHSSCNLTLKALGGGVFHPLREVFWLITSEVESFSTRNFAAFPNIKCRINKK